MYLLKTFLLVTLSAFFLVLALWLIPDDASRSLSDESKKSGFSDPRIELAVTYIERTQQPMLGVRMLKGLLAEDSTNAEVLHWLGRFALMSGQFEIAEQRFSTLLQNDAPDSLKWFAYASLDYAFEQQGKYKSSLQLLDDLARDIVAEGDLTFKDSVNLINILRRREEVERNYINNP